MVITHERGITATAARPITVSNVAPQVGLAKDLTGPWGRPLDLGLVITEPGSADLTSLEYSLTSGDGHTATGCGGAPAFVHAYARPGVFTSTAEVRDKDGGLGVASTTVSVTRHASSLAFAGSRPAPGGGLLVRARLHDDTHATVVPGAPVHFELMRNATVAHTDAAGLAVAALPQMPAMPGLHALRLSFDGDDWRAESTSSTVLARPGVWPPVVAVSLTAGSAATTSVEVVVPRSLPAADLILAFDVTASMDDVLRAAREQAGDLMRELAWLIDDARYAVVSHRDYDLPLPSSCGRTARPNDLEYPYRLEQALTQSVDLIERALRPLRAFGGGDVPESYTRVMYESYADDAVGRRAGARQIVVLFNDAVPHDDNLLAGLPDRPGIWDTGPDPGRDATTCTLDDLDLQMTLSEMAQRKQVMFVVRSTPRDLDLWEHWASLTSGRALLLGRVASGLEAAVAQAIEAHVARMDGLTLTVPPEYADWVSIRPAAYDALSPPAQLSFALSIRPPLTAQPARHAFDLTATAQGVEYGAVRVEAEVSSPVLPSPTPTSTTSPTPAPTLTPPGPRPTASQPTATPRSPTGRLPLFLPMTIRQLLP